MKRMPFHTTALLRRFAAGFFLVAGMLSCSAPQATFTNPLRDGADPWITKYDGRYYTCFKSGRGIAVTESDDMTRFERERVVWQPADSGAWNSFNIWAPELPRLRGKWYIYYAAAPVPGSPFTGQRTGVLECDTPLGDYRDRGMLYTGGNPDGKTVAATDLLVPTVGEIIGCSERETDLEKLTQAMIARNMPLENYKDYLDTRKYGTVEHSGFGLGFDRMVMYITGIGNIRDVLQFPRAYKKIY